MEEPSLDPPEEAGREEGGRLRMVDGDQSPKRRRVPQPSPLTVRVTDSATTRELLRLLSRLSGQCQGAALDRALAAEIERLIRVAA